MSGEPGRGAIRAVIVDDEPLARRGLRRALEDVDGGVMVVSECADGDQALQAIRTHQPDVAFLDIEMPGLDGLAVAGASADSPAPAFVFVTAHAQHAVGAFTVDAVDYLLKPLDRERLRIAIARIRRLRSARAAESEDVGDAAASSERFVVKKRGTISLVAATDVLWVEAAQNYAILHTCRQSHLYRGTLTGIAARFRQKFLRIHRSRLVNVGAIDHLESVSGGEYAIVLSDGTTLLSSRRYRRNLDVLLDG